MLPTEIQETIHMLFIIMWATGFTPKAWKISNTILIEKQRRWNGGIFLSPNWLSKYPLQTMDAAHHKHSLWICRSKHTQHHTSWILQTKRPHSPARKRDYGTRRCQTLSQRHLRPYCGLYLSFQYHWPRSHALDNVWPRFPTDTIDAVKNLYEDATTHVKLPSGVCTGQIPVERGTIQGDTLSVPHFCSFSIRNPSCDGCM